MYGSWFVQECHGQSGIHKDLEYETAPPTRTGSPTESTPKRTQAGWTSKATTTTVGLARTP